MLPESNDCMLISFGNFLNYFFNYLAIQSHYREVLRWEIFMELELRFGLNLGRLTLMKKNWADYEQHLRLVFHIFMGKE